MYTHTRFAAQMGASLLLLLLMATKLQAQTRYRISFPNPNGHLMQVEARFEGYGTDPTVYMPVWTPGSYLIREYAKNVETLAALDDAGQPLAVERVGKDGWRVLAAGKPFSVRYRTYANELAVRNAHVDASHAFFTPAAVLMYHKGLADKASTVEVGLPAGWKTVSTALEAIGPNTFTAKNLDELLDSPFEIGSHTEQSMMLEGVRYRFATYPATTIYTDKHLADFADVITQANRVMGTEPPPMKEYLFIAHLAGGGGGLEHMASTVIQGGPNTLTDAKAYQGYLSLIAHEYFHLWNVKRIKPRRLGPFDYQAENYTTTLWFAEGITSYYDDLITARAGKMTRDEYLAVLAANINNAGSVPGWRVQTLAQSSHEAWIKYYRPTENSANATVNYYTHGSVLGWAMDMHIRALTKGTKSLDNVMQLLWQRAKADANFYADRAAIAAVLGEVCGADQSAWLEGLVAQNNFPDVEKLALEAGLLPVDKRKERFWPTLGIAQQRQGDRVVAAVVFRDGPAEKAGIYYGDVLVSVAGKKLAEPYKEDDFTFAEGQMVPVEVLRQGQPMTFNLAVAASPRMRWQMGWSGSKTPKTLKGWVEKR